MYSHPWKDRKETYRRSKDYIMEICSVRLVTAWDGTLHYVMSRYSVDTVDSLDIIYTQISDPRQCLVYSRHHRDWVLVG